MDTEMLARDIANCLEDKLGLNIIILEVEQLVGYASHFVIASGQASARFKADHLKAKMKAEHDVVP